MNVTAIVTILYMLIVLAIGYLTSRKSASGAREFFVAGGNLHWMLLTPFLLAEFISSGTTVGVAEKVNKDGISVFFLFLAWPIGLAVMVFVFAKFYQSIKKVSIGEALIVLFDQRTRLVCVTTLMAGSVIASGTASLALATIVAPMFNMSYTAGVWASITFMVLLAIMGLRGQAWMNIIHFIAIIVCFVVVAVAANGAAGGLDNIFASLPPGHLNVWQAGLGKIVPWLISSILMAQISLMTVTAMFAARSEADARISMLTTGVCVFLFTLLPTLIGLAARVVAPGIDPKLALWTMGERLGSWATTMVSVGVVAAIISTTPGFILAMAAAFTRDFFLLAKPSASDRMQINVCRLAMVVLGFLGTAIAFALSEGTTLIELGNKTAQVRVIVAIPFLISILWRRINSTAVCWAVITGVASGLIWLFIGSPFSVEPIWPTLGVGTLTLVMVSLVKKPAPYKGIEGLELGTNSGPTNHP